jgi:orotate phosphoribosyltransferase
MTDLTRLKLNAEQLAKVSLHIGAIKVNPEKPVQWASGYYMPIYNDNRLLLAKAPHRRMVSEYFSDIMSHYGIRPDVIAGTATAGIPHATTLADRLNLPLIYIRDKPKAHGLRNQIEGIPDDQTLEGKTVLVIEDLVSTGGSSVKAVQAVRDAKGTVEHCISIFNYGFNEAQEMFEGKREYRTEENAPGPRIEACKLHSILTYDTLLAVALERGDIQKEHLSMLKEWRESPFDWGNKHGFFRILKS